MEVDVLKPKPKLINTAPDHEIWIEYNPDSATKTHITISGEAVQKRTGNPSFTFGVGYHVRKKMIEALLDHLEYDEEGW